MTVTHKKAAPGWTPGSGEGKTPEGLNSKPQAGPMATQPTISAILSDRLELVASQMALLETLIGAAKSLELDGHEIFGLFSLLGGWRVKIDEIANQPSADEPAPAPASAPEPMAAVPPLTEKQIALITLLKESLDRTQEARP